MPDGNEKVSALSIPPYGATSTATPPLAVSCMTSLVYSGQSPGVSHHKRRFERVGKGETFAAPRKSLLLMCHNRHMHAGDFFNYITY
jgi:hypothetical protein